MPVNGEVQGARQLPLALQIRQGKCFADFVEEGQSILIPLLQSLVMQPSGQVYLHGEAGTGKSHLLEACVAYAEQQGVRACLLSGALLVDLPTAVLDGMEDAVRLLALDDVDGLVGHPEWEVAWFHLYNRMKQVGGAMLFAARRTPRSAGFQLPDLMSRLGAGPVLGLSPLGEAGLVALLQEQAKARGLELGSDLARFIVERAPRQPAALVHLLDKLDQAALATSRRLTVPFVKQQLGW